MFEEAREAISGLKEVLVVVLKDDDLFNLGAKAMKKSFDALVQVGFTEDQAIRLLTGQGGINLNA